MLDLLPFGVSQSTGIADRVTGVAARLAIPVLLRRRLPLASFAVSTGPSSVGPDVAAREEARLIARSESLYPDPTLIEREVATFLGDPRNQGDGWEQRHREAAAEPGPRWWWLVDDPWWPFAVTARGGAR
jgi:hypothetical protein